MSPSHTDTVAAETVEVEHVFPSKQDPSALPFVRDILALEDVGWHIVDLQPSSTDELALWRVKIERYDEHATMTMTDADPGAALPEILRYVQVDAR